MAHGRRGTGRLPARLRPGPPGPAKHVSGRVARDRRAAVPAAAPTAARAGGVRGSAERRSRGDERARRAQGGQHDPVAAEGRHRVGRAGCSAANHATTPPAAAATGKASGRRWSAWPTTTATATTATARTSAPSGCIAETPAARNATAASWQKGQHMRQHPTPRTSTARTWTTSLAGRSTKATG